MSIYKTVREIADEFGVTVVTVRNWLKAGLPSRTEKVVGIKPRKVMTSEDVEKFINKGIRKAN